MFGFDNVQAGNYFGGGPKRRTEDNETLIWKEKERSRITGLGLYR